MRRIKAAGALVALFALLAVVPLSVPRADIGGAISGRWGLAMGAVGAIAGGILGGVAGSFIAPGPGTVIGEMTGSDLGIIVGGA